MTRIVFKGKSAVVNSHLTAPYCHLEAIPKKSLLAKGANPSLHDNVVIHGDNLRALKALLPTHAGRVNCVYIDPPYNTGKEGWRYNDRVNNEMMRDWLGKVVDREDLTRHDKWLCMMWPRLSLLRELLAEDGVIFVSIDDHEAHRLRMMMDEIFGDDNFVANIIWQKKYAPSGDASFFSDNHDFVLCYAKNKNNGHGWRRRLLPRTDKQDKLYKHDDGDGKGLWRTDNLTVKTYSAEYDFPITNPLTGKQYNPPQGACWRTSKENMQRWIDEKRVFFGKDGKGKPQLKRYLNEVQQGIVPMTVWLYDEVGHTDGSRKTLKDIFNDEKLPFDNPKAVGLVKRIITIAGDKNIAVLDSFAGSGTTAQAVLELNKEDGGERKFVLVECEDYADKITAERVRRIIRGVKGAKDDALREGFGGNFGFWQLSKPMKLEGILKDGKLPSFEDLAGYVFYTATGEQWNPKQAKKRKFFVGESRHYEVYMIYKPDVKFLRETALTLEMAQQLPKAGAKWRLVFAPVRYAHIDELGGRKIKFCQLPFEIYRAIK